MKKLMFSAVLVGSASLPVAVHAQNLFSNPSFEDGAGAVTFSASSEFGGATAYELTSPSTDIPGWFWQQPEIPAGGAAWLEDSSDFFGSDGDHLLFLDTNQAIEWSDAGGALSAGETVSFDYNFATWERGQDIAPGDPSSGEGTILLEYRYRNQADDLAFGLFTTNLRPPANGDSAPGALAWLSGSESLVIPADYGSAFNLFITSSGTGMLVDNLALNAAPSVPEPRTPMMLGLATMLLFLRQSRRR